ncbi:hypothetical protein MRX96_025582 [Rhipicephalus microplus]
MIPFRATVAAATVKGLRVVNPGAHVVNANCSASTNSPEGGNGSARQRDDGHQDRLVAAIHPSCARKEAMAVFGVLGGAIELGRFVSN